jgi:AmiR/NasT family two-component response regulator
MDMQRIKTITIAHLDFLAITNGKTGNPIAESEIPEMLRQAIKTGVQVVITDPMGNQSCQLILSKAGQFQYAPLA